MSFTDEILDSTLRVNSHRPLSSERSLKAAADAQSENHGYSHSVTIIFFFVTARIHSMMNIKYCSVYSGNSQGFYW